MNNPYKKNIDNIEESKEVVDDIELMKYALVSEFIAYTSKIDNKKVLKATGLHKSDLSRLQALDIDRFTIDKLLSVLFSLGLSTEIKIKKKAS